MKHTLTKNFSSDVFLQTALVILFLCSIFASASAQNNTPQHQNGKIAYATGDTYSNIYTVNPDGSNNTDVSSFPNGTTSGLAEDLYPFFSWDGKKIYFTSYRDYDSYGETYVMGANGENPTRLSFNTFDGGNGSVYPYDTYPSVSPDGTTVIFQGSCPSAPACIRSMSASGYTSTHTTSGSAIVYQGPNPSFALRPSYSADGSKIVFDNNRDLYVINANGSGATKITGAVSGTDQFMFARFSPDGSKIVCQHVVNNGNFTYDIWVMDANGANQTPLTTTGDSSMPAWSPDGAKIVFQKTAQTYNLYTMDANGANQTLVISSFSGNQFQNPTWGASPYVAVTPANASNLTVAFSNVNGGGDTSAAPISPSSPPQGYTFPPNAPAYDITTTANYSGTIDVTLKVQNISSSAYCNYLRILHFTGGAWTDAGNAAPQYNAGTMVCTLTQTVTSLSPFAVAQIAAGPTAAGATVSGRVMTGKRGIRNALVTLIEQDGTSHTVSTGVSGSYQFDDIAAGQTIIVSIRAKRFTFSQPAQVLTVSENLAGVNFYADENFIQPYIGWR